MTEDSDFGDLIDEHLAQIDELLRLCDVADIDEVLAQVEELASEHTAALLAAILVIIVSRPLRDTGDELTESELSEFSQMVCDEWEMLLDLWPEVLVHLLRNSIAGAGWDQEGLVPLKQWFLHAIVLVATLTETWYQAERWVLIADAVDVTEVESDGSHNFYIGRLRGA